MTTPTVTGSAVTGSAVTGSAVTGSAVTGSDRSVVLDVLWQRLESPTAKGLATAVSRSVGSGALPDGTRLPPIRMVADYLGLSPTTVSSAWALLNRSGTIHTDGRRGTHVATRSALPSAMGPKRYRRALGRRTPFALDLSTGVPDAALLPELVTVLGQVGALPSTGSYLDDPVLPELAELLRASWPFDADRIAVFDGAMDALDQVLGSVLRFRDRVVVEHPGFPPLLDLLEALDVEVVGVPMDDEGLDPLALAAALAEPVAAVILQPRAQNPTGASMTQRRAMALAAVLADSEAVILEDDSAGAIANSPLVSLGQWLPGRTVHVRSFSKSHGPDLRISAVGGPAAVLDAVLERRLLGQGWTSRILQRLLYALLTTPRTIEQVDHAREEYARRRRAAVRALAREGIEIDGVDGINIWLPVADEAGALVHLASHGIGASAGAPFAVLPSTVGHLRLTTGLVGSGTPDDAGNRVDRAWPELAAVIADASRIGARTAPR